MRKECSGHLTDIITGLVFILLVCGMLFIACEKDIPDLPEEDIPQVLADCGGYENNLKNAIYGYNQGSVLLMQKKNAIMKYETCLRDGGLSPSQATEITNEKVAEYNEEFG